MALSYRRHRFPPEIIQHAIWLYLRFTLSYRDVEDLLAQRGLDSRAALRLMRKLLKKHGFAPKLLVTDKLRSYAAAFRRLRLTCPHEQGSGRIICQRIRIRPRDDESASSSASSPLDLPSASCTPPSTIPSI